GRDWRDRLALGHARRRDRARRRADGRGANRRAVLRPRRAPRLPCRSDVPSDPPVGRTARPAEGGSVIAARLRLAPVEETVSPPRGSFCPMWGNLPAPPRPFYAPTEAVAP